MNILISLAAGVIFGAGLLISGMMDPAKVKGFLDLFGNWDPSLMFVMGSALAITIPAFHFILKKDKPSAAPLFDLPLNNAIDKPLLLGAAVFGIGWGLYGYCPGPAISSLASLSLSSLIFVLCMIVGMFAAQAVSPKK